MARVRPSQTFLLLSEKISVLFRREFRAIQTIYAKTWSWKSDA